MINTLAIGNYRSLLNLVTPLDSLNVITGSNASGKSNLYRALKLLAETAQGGPRQKTARLRLGFSGDDFGYSISLGLPTPSHSAFSLDPEIKRECIWARNAYRPASLLVDNLRENLRGLILILLH